MHLALSYDEEVGCVGAVSLVDEIVERGLRPRACIVGEPTSMRVIRGHKSLTMIAVTFHGVAAHSSRTPHGVNAIEYAAQLVRFVRGVADGFRTDGPFDEHYDVPFTTATVNQIEGGIAVNTVPAECSLTFEFRAVGAVDVDATIEEFRAEARRIEEAMRQENPDARVEVSIGAQAPGLDTRRRRGRHRPRDRPRRRRRARRRWPTAPRPGSSSAPASRRWCAVPETSPRPTHPDEFVALEQIERCDALLGNLISHLSA